MKPLGPIPPEFAGQRGALQIGGRPAAHWITVAGATPLFVYDMAIVAARIARLRAAMPAGTRVHYALKANPFAPLLAAIAPLVDGFDVASAGELAMTAPVIAPDRVSIAGPGKRDDALEAAIRAGATINLESAREGVRALDVATRIGITPRLAVRVNPDFELRGSGMRMGGRASPFGVEPAAVPALVRTIRSAGADWRGFHVFAGSQALDADAIIAAQAHALALVARLADAIGAGPPLVNLGGGFGIPYFAGETPLDIEGIGTALGDAMTSRAAILADTAIALELGRWLVGEAGVYLTRVIDRKESRGETFVVTDGGLHHQLAASGNLGSVVRRNYPLALAHAMGAPPGPPVTVTGCLCTPLDRLAVDAPLPEAAEGDIVAIFCAGAYGLSASPTRFLGHAAPTELLVGTADNPNAIFTS